MFPSPTANKLKFPAVNQNSKTKCTKNSKTICFYFQLHGIYPTLDDPIKIRYDSSKLPGLSKVLTINKSLLFSVSRANLCVQSKQTLEASRLTIILFHINSITTLTPLPLYIHPYLTLCKSSSFFFFGRSSLLCGYSPVFIYHEQYPKISHRFFPNPLQPRHISL